jgi:hypothetical protein
VFRLLFLLLGTLTANRSAGVDRSVPRGSGAGRSGGISRLGAAGRSAQAEPAGRSYGERLASAEPGTMLRQPDEPDGGWPAQPPPRRRRRRIRRRAWWAAAGVAAALIFRRAIASVVLTALSGTLHLVGVNVHLPSVRFGWPGQTVGSAGTSTVDLGPWVLQKIEGISRPALGQENFNFVFTRRVSKSIGIWPCWYSATFYAVGRAAATVELNPGPAWWRPAAGHYRLQVLRQPQAGVAGQVAVTMVLPQPQLPQSVHDVTIDNIPSRPLASQHSWTYPGLGCGVLLRPQFAQSVLYAQAQQIAFGKTQHAPQVTRPLIRAAQAEADRTVRDNFIQPTVNALGYTLTRFTLRWTSAPARSASPASSP